MAQHDYSIANQSAPNARTDLNNALAAIVSQNSGATAPSTTFANMIWYDTANNLLKMRNEADTAWITLATLDQSANTSSAAVTIASQAEAEAGTNNTKLMTPLRVQQAIDNATATAGHLGVGTYAVLINNSGSAITAGTTIAGSSLRYGVTLSSTLYGVVNTTGTLGGTNASGTWRLMGSSCPALSTATVEGTTTYYWSAGLFYRES
jgi:hypothetical protein